MTTPTWQELRNDGWMVVDQPTLLLAAYPSENGAVVIAFAHPHDQTMQGCRFDHSSVPLLLKQLEHAQRYAQERQESSMEFAAAQLTFDVLASLRKGVR